MTENNTSSLWENLKVLVDRVLIAIGAVTLLGFAVLYIHIWISGL